MKRPSNKTKGNKGFYAALGISAVMIGSACYFAYDQGNKIVEDYRSGSIVSQIPQVDRKVTNIPKPAVTTGYTARAVTTAPHSNIRQVIGTVPTQQVQAVPEAEVTEPVAEVQSIKLVRGARFDLSGYNDKMLVIDMDYQAEQGIDIDGYIFLLAANGKVRSDADLVFFGQKASVDRAVNNHPSKTRCFTVELSKLDADVSKLAVAFAIYGDNAEQIFSCVSKPVVRISCNGQEICSYEVEGLKEEKSVVAIEMYNKNGWKLRTVGLGYKEALKTLCGSYGVEVNSQ